MKQSREIQPVKTLPPDYHLHGTLDLSKNKVALIGLNIAALIPLVLFGWLALWLLPVLRPTDASQVLRFVGVVGTLQLLAILLGLYVLMIILHEAIHGLFFWVFTRERPHYGFKGWYAYAAAPDWYLPHRQHMVVGLAPLVLITLVGFALVPLVPLPLVPMLLYIVVMNAAGAVGDMAMVAWLAVQPHGTLVQDSGDAIALFRSG